MTDLERQNPWVPLGALTTAGVLGSGLWAFNKGKANTSQLMMVSFATGACIV